MEQKKSNKANLERKRGSILLLGLVCATSTALMSFEYANFELKTEANLMSSVSSDDDVWELIEPKIEYASAPVVEPQSKSDYVVSSPEPDPVPVPEPEPEPEPLPTPGPVIPGPPGPPTIIVPDPEPVLDDIPYEVVEQMPEFPGGFEEMYKFLSNNIKYPQSCIDNNVQGKSYIKFTIEKDGSISNMEVVKSSHSLLDKEAIRVIGKMPNWKPGRQLNKVVRVNYTLPINFVLD
jgi:protein TonB